MYYSLIVLANGLLLYNDRAQLCRYCSLRPQRALMAVKRANKVEMSSYLYSAKKFLPYPMWDVTNTPMQTMGLQSQMDKHSLQGQTKQTPTSGSGIGSDIICNDPA